MDYQTHAPWQVYCVRRVEDAAIPRAVHLAAYEVYAAVHGEQLALCNGDCRGGFGAGELVAFLYARSFPRTEWRRRVDEAMDGMTTR